MFRVSPKYKKSFVERYYFIKEGRVVTIDCIWRSGSILLPEISQSMRDQGEGDYCTITEEQEYEFEFADDGHYEIVGPDDISSKTEEEVQELLDSDGISGLEYGGWQQSDFEFIFHGPLLIEEE